MIRNHSQGRTRSAFTLVELMVVILIIAILVSLISSAVIKALGKIPEVQTRNEITQLEIALRAFMTDYGLADPPPSVLYLNEYNPLSPSPLDGGRTVNFLQKVFGKNFAYNPLTPGVPLPIDWNGDGSIDGPALGQPWVLQGEQCLIFYIGGIPNSAAVAAGATPGPLGFSTNNINPASPSGKRKGPYNTFVNSRLWPGPGQVPAGWNGFFVYIDPWQTKTGPLYGTMGGSPYAFFSSGGLNNAYAATSAIGAAPYAIRSAVAPYALTGQFTNPNTYQIISAGKDGTYGNTGWIPQSGFPPIPFTNADAAGQPAGADDQANFSGSLLGAGQS